MSGPVSFDKRRWISLTELAQEAAMRAEVYEPAGRLGRLATDMVRAAIEGDQDQKTLFISFRWDCLAFAVVDQVTRHALAPGLRAKALQVARRLSGGPPPDAAQLAMFPEEPAPSWTRRADVGG